MNPGAPAWCPPKRQTNCKVPSLNKLGEILGLPNLMGVSLRNPNTNHASRARGWTSKIISKTENPDMMPTITHSDDGQITKVTVFVNAVSSYTSKVTPFEITQKMINDRDVSITCSEMSGMILLTIIFN